MTNTSRIAWHHTPGAVNSLPPVLRQLTKRVLPALRPGTRVILPEGLPVDELLLLNELGIGPHADDIIWLRDGQLPPDVHGQILPFTGCSAEQRTIAEAAHLSLFAPPLEVCLRANSKATFQDMINALGIRPRGVVVPQPTPERLQAAVNGCFQTWGVQQVIVKGHHSASGIEMQLISASQPQVDPTITFTDVAVIQEFIPAIASPSASYYLKRSGSWKMLGVTMQLLEGGTHHVGNIFPSTLSPAVQRQIDRYSEQLLPHFAALGCFGPLGLDFIITPSGEVYPVEANFRVVAPWYPLETARVALGEYRPFIMRSFHIAPTTTVERARQVLAPILFRRDTGCGVVPFAWLPQEGFAYVILYADTLADLRSEWPLVEGLMAHLA